MLFEIKIIIRVIQELHISVDLSALWSDETDKVIKGISEATENIQAYIDATEHFPNMLAELGEDISDVCRFWTGSTY